MTAYAPTYSASWRVGPYTCTLTVPRLEKGRMLSAVIEWEPCVPPRLSGSELREYRRGRDRVLVALARDLGGTAALVEV